MDPFPNHSCGRCLWEGVFFHKTQPFWPEPPLVVGSLPQRQHRHPEQHQQAQPNLGLECHSHDTTSRHRLSITFKERGKMVHEDLTHHGCSHQVSRYPATQSLSEHSFRSSNDAKYVRKFTLSSDGKPADEVNRGSLSSNHNYTSTSNSRFIALS